MRPLPAASTALASCLCWAASAGAQLAVPVLPPSPAAPFVGLPAPLVPSAPALTPALPSPSAGLLAPSLVLPPAVVPDAARLQDSIRAFQAAPEAPEAALPRDVLRTPRSAAPAAAPREEYVRGGGSSVRFRDEVSALLKTVLPEKLLQDVLAHGYILLAKDHLTQDRTDFPADYDYTGGLHDWGPKGNFIMVAERIKDRATGQWLGSLVWRNAAVHETGHAVDHILGLTDNEELRTAWEADVAAMPDELKREWLPNGLSNDFYYFLREDRPGGRDLARQETFAEAFDIIFRGAGSAFNYDSFTRHFPRTLDAARALLERRYGLLTGPDAI